MSVVMRAEDVHKRFGPLEVLKGVSMEVQSGETVCVIGPSGSGKTTSLIAFIGATELFQDAEIHYSQTFKPVEYFAAVAFWYLVLTSVWSLVQLWIERKLGASDRSDVVDGPWRRLRLFAPFSLARGAGR